MPSCGHPLLGDFPDHPDPGQYLDRHGAAFWFCIQLGETSSWKMSKRQAAAEFIVERLTSSCDNMGYHFDKYMSAHRRDLRSGASQPSSVSYRPVEPHSRPETTPRRRRPSWYFVLIMYYKIRPAASFSCKESSDPSSSWHPSVALSEVPPPSVWRSVTLATSCPYIIFHTVLGAGKLTLVIFRLVPVRRPGPAVPDRHSRPLRAVRLVRLHSGVHLYLLTTEFSSNVLPGEDVKPSQRHLPKQKTFGGQIL